MSSVRSEGDIALTGPVSGDADNPGADQLNSAQKMGRRPSWTMEEAGHELVSNQKSSDKPNPGLMLRKVPSFTALRSQGSSTSASNIAPTNSVVQRTSLPVRHKPLASLHHNHGPYPHPHTNVTPLPPPPADSATRVSPTGTMPPRTASMDGYARIGRKAGELLKNSMTTSNLSDGRELVVETDVGAPGQGRPPLFKSPTLPLPVNKSRLNPEEEDGEDFVWSGSPDPKRARAKRSFSNHLLPRPNDPPPGIAPLITNPSRLQAGSAVLSEDGSISPTNHAASSPSKSYKAATQPRLKKSTEMRTPSRSSGSVLSRSLLPMSTTYGSTGTGQFFSGNKKENADDDEEYIWSHCASTNAYHQQHQRSHTDQIASSARQSSGESYLEYGWPVDPNDEHIYLLANRRYPGGNTRSMHTRSRRDLEAAGSSANCSRFGRPKSNAHFFFIACAIMTLLATAAFLTMCIQPLSGFRLLGVSTVTGTNSRYEFDMVFAGSNSNFFDIAIRTLDMDVSVARVPYLVQNNSTHDAPTSSPESGNHTPSASNAAAVPVSTPTNTAGKELLAHVQRFSIPASFPSLSQTHRASAHVNIRDPESTVGKAIYKRPPYLLSLRGTVSYTVLGWFEYNEGILCVARITTRDGSANFWHCETGLGHPTATT
ncbi:hypothetical protein DFS34DRAFT_184992 [Phlyctochytrium arcticum]|nr:hypothetical protein DFS34DRAFT_184992 [Phlyctochytrium arcticum]